MGAASGMSADGSIIRDNEQAPDVWVGTTFSLAPLLLSEGMKEEAYHPAWGLHHVIYENKGYWFPHSGSMGHQWELPRFDVHASCGSVCNGNDAATPMSPVAK